MTVTLIATARPKPGRLQEYIDAFGPVLPLVHQEKGCELYSLHSDGEKVIVIERWASQDDLIEHANGAAIGSLTAINDDVLSEPLDVQVLTNIPFGDPTKATIQ
jgi:quinol monooxygenase YgiN